MIYFFCTNDKVTYNIIIIGIEIKCKVRISPREVNKKKYLTTLFFIEYSLNFSENKGISAFIKYVNNSVIRINSNNSFPDLIDENTVISTEGWGDFQVINGYLMDK